MTFCALLRANGLRGSQRDSARKATIAQSQKASGLAPTALINHGFLSLPSSATEAIASPIPRLNQYHEPAAVVLSQSEGPSAGTRTNMNSREAAPSKARMAISTRIQVRSARRLVRR